MAEPSAHAFDLARSIQLAIGPVVLVSGVGLLLGVLTNRLGRIVDRARLLIREYGSYSIPQRAHAREELIHLRRRASLTSRAIGFNIVCVLLIGILITLLFVGALFEIDLAPVAAIAFAIAILAMIASMSEFLREIFIAVKTLHLDVQEYTHDSDIVKSDATPDGGHPAIAIPGESRPGGQPPL